MAACTATRQAEPKDLIFSFIHCCALPERAKALGPAWATWKCREGRCNPSCSPKCSAWPIRTERRSLLQTCQSTACTQRLSLYQKLCLSVGLSANSVIQGDSSTDASSHPKHRIDLPVVSDVNPSLNTWKSSFSFMMNMHKFVSSCAKSHIMDM